MVKEIKKIEDSAGSEIPAAKNREELEGLRIKFLGREKGALTLILRSLKTLPDADKKRVGEEANKLRGVIEGLFAARTEELKRTETESILKKEWLDVTRPGKKGPHGHLHPVTLVRREVEKIFASMGFGVVEGPEVETEWYNFDALNIPVDHPARDMVDTFFLKNPKGKNQSPKLLLRTHTSPVQIRYMQKHNSPLRIIVPGRVYRYEATDASHDIQFQQVEGLMVDKNVSVANFKGVVLEFFKKLFGMNVEIRLRPSFFPFTEPSFEIDISCIACNKKGCSICKKTGWLEVMGAGMVHPKVFEAAGYAPGNQQGFAFGFGLDRVTMMKYKIPDIRLFHSGDIRFLKQF